MRTWLVLLLVCAMVWQSDAFWRRRRRRTNRNCFFAPIGGAHTEKETCHQYHGGKCCFKCKSGYGRVSGDWCRTCNNGKWDGQRLKCGRCPWITSTNAIKSCSWPHPVGEVCYFQCKSEKFEYESGSDVRKCLTSKSWSGSKYKCKRKPNSGWLWGK